MHKLLYSGIRAIYSLFTYGMLQVFVKSIGVTVGALIVFVLSSSLFFSWLAHVVQGHAIASLLPWLGSIGSVFLAYILFPGIMPVIINFFDETIAVTIEDHDYPKAAKGIDQPFWPKFWHDARFSLMTIGLNVLVLPLYLLPGINLFLFYLLNGYLLGREFFSMAARRHLTAREADTMFHDHSMTIISAGILLAVMATIPFVNLFAPFWGIAIMVHLYHRLEPRLELELISTKASRG